MKADHQQVARLLKTARGQIDGILKMVEEDRYCLDVSSQIMAAQSILKKANRMVLRAHMDCCVREAAASGDPGDSGQREPGGEAGGAGHPAGQAGRLSTRSSKKLCANPRRPWGCRGFLLLRAGRAGCVLRFAEELLNIP